MRYPAFSETPRYREMLVRFGGYNHTLGCGDGEFYDMYNMSTQHYPVLSPRARRGICRQFENPQGILDKEQLMWVDGATLYLAGRRCVLADGVTISTEAEKCPKTMAKMGAYVIILPDRIWYNVDDATSGYMEAETGSALADGSVGDVAMSLCDAGGKSIVWHDEAYYKGKTPSSGDYCMAKVNGKSVLKQWAASSSVWVEVSSSYFQILCTGIGKGFSPGDGIKVTIDTGGVYWEHAADIFVNAEWGGKRSVNTYVVDRTDDCITVPGLLAENVTFREAEGNALKVTVERKVPDMAFITECGNRLWGCSKDGHEVYCCKLGDVKNWNCFMGTATDSWAATVGSDGKFTGAVTFQGYPVFFKEDTMLKISVSATGGHQTRESGCRGVQAGSARSICVMNERLYYKSPQAVCMYVGSSQPVAISQALGEEGYYDAVGGAVGDRYYLSMRDGHGKYSMFVYDAGKGLWSREDGTQALYFCRHKDDLYFIDSRDNRLKSVRGSVLYDPSLAGEEKELSWYVESGEIGFSMPDNKYVAKVNIRMALAYGAEVDFYLQYDSGGTWEHVWGMTGTGTRSFLVPVLPRRCDHFRYKIAGRGDAKIFSVARTVEEGSDI
ncbi:MAG: hypothetical protein K2P87_16475 [Lachnospiraceae bacterium]|nr:hypothetical protein [Lachnospiraceae bacterium]